MKNEYSYLLEVNSRLCDNNCKIKFDSVLEIFQDATNFHSYVMGIDKDSLIKSSNAFFVLTKLRFTISQDVFFNDTISVRTWPLKITSPIRFNREYQIQKGGYSAINGHSEWCVLDYETRQLRKVSSVKYPSELIHNDEKSDDKSFNSYLKIDRGEKVYTHKVRYTDLDFNNHTNNVSYVKMALNSFSPSEFSKYNFKGYEIHFNKETTFNDEIEIYKSVVDNGVYIEGLLNNVKIFECMFER